MPQAEALMIVTTLHEQLASLARHIVTALEDDRISFWEGLQLGQDGTQLGLAILNLLQHTDAVTVRELLWLLEHGQWTLPSPPP